MPKGHQRYSKYETVLIKTARQLTKAVRRLQVAAAELEARPEPTAAASKPAKKVRHIRLSQLTIPETKRKAAKAPVQRKRA